MNTLKEISTLLPNKIREIKIKYLKLGIFLSAAFHLLIIITIQIILFTGSTSTKRIKIIRTKAIPVTLEKIKPEINESTIEKTYSKPKDTVDVKKTFDSSLFAGYKIDTTSLIQKYEENTLNVSIFFPTDWVFFDNKVKDIIDGIIFMPGPNSDYDPRISVVIQVVSDKSLFRPSSYDSSIVVNDYEYFFKTPEIVFEQVTQTVYVRTGIFKADFLIKLTSPNEVEFKKIQPVFIAMVKSFSAGY
ncbi:MAG: hypothetical protein N3A61_05880 [Ignavibacteria bacterium]|nr:hypothetical protein [Ignavibacteria bacterium]